jgi:hypothetical protein
MHTTGSVDDEGKERCGAAPGGIVLNDFAPLSFAFLSLRLCPDPFSVTNDGDSADVGTVLSQYPAPALLATVRFAYPRATTLQSLSLLAPLHRGHRHSVTGTGVPVASSGTWAKELLAHDLTRPRRGDRAVPACRPARTTDAQLPRKERVRRDFRWGVLGWGVNAAETA